MHVTPWIGGGEDEICSQRVDPYLRTSWSTRMISVMSLMLSHNPVFDLEDTDVESHGLLATISKPEVGTPSGPTSPRELANLTAPKELDYIQHSTC
jgi:hypothetical protein